MRRVLPLACISLALSARALAAPADDSDLVAVLPLDVSHSELKESATLLLQENIRTVAGDVLTPLGYTVLTGETTISILQANDVDIKKACESSCALDNARE